MMDGWMKMMMMMMMATTMNNILLTPVFFLLVVVPKSCSEIKRANSTSTNGSYVIDPDGEEGLDPFTVLCDMSSHDGVGVTVVGHDSENRTHVTGFEKKGSYSRNVAYTGASVEQLGNLTKVSNNCEQSIKYECLRSKITNHAWLVSRDGARMLYWDGGAPGNECVCGMKEEKCSTKNPCNCDKEGGEWRNDAGLLTHKPDLPVSQLRFGDTGDSSEEGYHTLGKLKCYGVANTVENTGTWTYHKSSTVALASFKLSTCLLIGW